MDKSILSRIALAACLFSLFVIGLGAFTRLIDAGLGCPDWPGCYGHLTVPMTASARAAADIQYPATPLIAYKAWAEMGHRYAVGALSIFILCIVGMILIKKSLRTRVNVLLSFFIVGLLACQITLGQWTVTLKLLPIIVTQHLLGGYFILVTLWLIYLNNQSENAWRPQNKLLPWSLLGLVLLLCQIMLGAWTSTNYASLGCPDFPFCHNNSTAITWHLNEAFNINSFAPQQVHAAIQMMHRIGALIVATYLFSIIIYMIRTLKTVNPLSKLLILILGLLCLQIFLGISNVVFKLPIATAIGHTLTGVMLLLALITLNFKLAFHQSNRPIK